MGTLIAALGLKNILIVGLGIIAVGFVLKKLFKLAISIAVIAALIHFGLPILQTVMVK
ncbi:hypothetical protein [Desulfosporosinus sp. SB140]|uniref:hypothetical protein n=1 Tax=Desulfosporosinus paludis TaxID=3115649 RepID=UPI00388EC278